MTIAKVYTRKKINPTTPSQRFLSYPIKDYDDNSKREKSLVKSIRRSFGRDNHGRITSRGRSSSFSKIAYRSIAFSMKLPEIQEWYVVSAIQYDPFRNCPIVLAKPSSSNQCQDMKYFIRAEGVVVGSKFYVSKTFSENIPGSFVKIGTVPQGLNVFCVEMKQGKGAQIARSAGSFVKISGKDGDYVIVVLPSGEQRKIHKECLSVVGKVSMDDFKNKSDGKAGRARWVGKKPTVRGVAMNPVDHPHGGGEGKTSGGRNPTTPWGKTNKGTLTRRNKRSSSFIIRSRKKNK